MKSKISTEKTKIISFYKFLFLLTHKFFKKPNPGFSSHEFQSPESEVAELKPNAICKRNPIKALSKSA